MRAALVAVLLAGLLAAAGCRSDNTDNPTPTTPDIGQGGNDSTADGGRADFGPGRDLLPDPDLLSGSDTAPPPRDAGEPRDLTIFTDSGPKDGPSCAPSNDSCSAAKILTWSGNTIVENGDTSCATDGLDFPFDACDGVLVDGSSGPDVFYEITLPTGDYRVALDAPGWDPALYLIDACSIGSCIIASDNINAGVLEQVTISLATPTKLIIGVDAFDGANSGPFSLTIEKSSSPPPDSGPAPDATVDSGPAPDATVDAGPAPDATVDVGPVPDGAGAGNLIITELMPNPATVGDTEGEWLELHNAGSTSVNLKDWRIEDQPGTSQNTHTIAGDLIVPAGGYVVLGHSADTATNGGAPVDYAYGTAFTLANSADEVYLFDAAGVLVDQVEYDTGGSWTVATGASTSLKNPALDNNVAGNWCEETAAWTGSAGDKGTPGAGAGCP